MESTLLKLSAHENKILLWEPFTNIYLWTLMTFIAINYTNYWRISLKNKNLFPYLEILMFGDFNLLNYYEHNQTNQFLDFLASK